MIDLAFLTEAEQEAILKVLHRDAELKKSEEERVRHLPDIVSDENELKYKSGQWFYEAKSKRHSDKIHGADLVRASIRKRKKPSTIAELSEMGKSKSKRRSVNSVNKDIFIPPELFGVMDVPDEADEDLMPNKAETNQSAKRVSFSSTDLDKDILRNGLSSPAKQRKNPFNSKGLEDVTDSIPEGDQVNGQLEAKPDIMSSIIKYGVKLPYPELTGGRHISQKVADDSPPKPVVQPPVPKPRTFFTNGQAPQRADPSVKRDDSVNGTNRRGILKRRSSSSSTDSESIRIPHSFESNKIILPGSPILEVGQNYLFDEQLATSEGSPDRQKQVRFAEKVLQKPPSPRPEPYIVRETDEFGILEPGLYSGDLDSEFLDHHTSEERVPVQYPHSALDYNNSGQNDLLEKPKVPVTIETPSTTTSSLDTEEFLDDPYEEISNHKVQTILEEKIPERSIDYNGAEPLYAVVNKTPKVNSLNPAEEFAMEDALREPWFLGQGWKTPNTYQSEKPLVFGQSYGGGGKISFESRYPTRKPEESYIFTREPFLAPERAANIESSYSDLKNKTMATPQYDNDYVESVAAWRRPFLENKESLRRPTTDDPEQQKTSTRTVQKVPKVDFKDEGLLASAYAENEANSKYFPGDYKRETKYEPLFLRNTHNADRPAGPNLKSANFKVMSLKERMNEMPRQQMFDPSQFQSLKNFWTVEEKNLQTADVDTSPNKLLTDILNRNKPTRADLKQRNSREIPGDDLVFPNTFDSLSEEEQTSQKVASWLAQTPTVYGVNKVDHSEEPFEPGKEVIENIQKSAAIKKTNAEDFTSALQKLQIEASESPRIAEPEELRTEEISAVSLNSEEKRPPAADINTTYEQVLKRSTKPTAGKDTNLIVWDIPTMRSVQSEHSVGEPVEETVSKTVAPAKEESAFNIGLEKLQTEYAKPNEECQMDESNLPYEDLYEEDANEPEAVIEKSNAPKSRDQLDFISSLNKLEIEASKPLFLPTEDQDNLPEEEITLNTVSPVKSSYKIGFEHIISPEDNSPFQSPVEHSLTYQAPRYYPPNNTHSAEVVNEYEETVEKITVPKVESDLCSALKKLEIESQSNNENVEQDLEKSKINPSLQANKSPVQTTFIKSSTPLSSTEKEQPDLQLSYSNRAGRSVSAVEETPKEYSYEAKPMFQIELPKYTANTQENLPVEEEETIERTIVGTEENSGDFQNRLMRLQDEAATVSVESGDRSVYETVIFSESPNRKVISKIVFPSIESLPTYSYGTHDAEKTNEVVSNESSPWSKPKDHNEQKSPAYSRLEELAKYPRSADKSGFYNGDARNVLYKKPEISTGVSNSEPGKPAPAVSPSDSASSRHDKYTFEVMKAQDASISKVLDWFSRSSDMGDEQSPSVGLMEEAKNSRQQIPTRVGSSEDESGAGVDNVVNGLLTPVNTESISESELPKMAGNPHSNLLIGNFKNIDIDQSNILNAEFMTPIAPMEEDSIPLEQVHSCVKAEEPLEFGKSGGGCGKINNHVGNDDSVGKDLQTVEKMDVFENYNEDIKAKMEASILKSPSLVKVETGGTPVYGEDKEQEEVELTSSGPTVLEQSESLQNSKKQALVKLNIPQNRVSDIKQFWEGEKPFQSVTKKSVLKRTFSPSERSITPKSSSFDSDDQSGSSIVTFKKVMLEEDDDDQLSPIDQLKSFWENEKNKEVIKSRPGRPSMKNKSLDIESVFPAAEPRPDFRKRHKFNYYSEKEQITGPENNAPQRSVSLGENTNDGENDQQKSSNFQSLRSFWNVDSKSKGINPQVQEWSETSNRQFNSNPDISSKDPLTAKVKNKLASKSLEDIRNSMPDSSAFQSYDPKHDRKGIVTIPSQFNIEKINTTGPNCSVQESESASKQQFGSKVKINVNIVKKEVSEERSPSVECEVRDATPALPSNTSSITVETKQGKAVPTQEINILNDMDSVQNPGYSNKDDGEEFNKQPDLVTSLPQKNYVEYLKDPEPSFDNKSVLMYSSSAEENPEAIDNPSCDKNLNKLYNNESRPDEPNRTAITPTIQNRVESKVPILKKPSNSADPSLQEDFESPSKINQVVPSEKLTKVSEVVLKSFAPRKAEVKLNLQKLRDEFSDNHSSLPIEQKSMSSPLKPMSSSKSIENDQLELQDEENGEHIYSNVTNDGVPKKIIAKQGGFDNSLAKIPVDPDVSGSPPNTAQKDHSESVYTIKSFDSSEVPINESVEKTVVPNKKGFRGLQNLYNESLDTPITPNKNLPNDEYMEIQEPGQGVGEELAATENGSDVQRSSSTNEKPTAHQPLTLNISSKKTDKRNEDMYTPLKKLSSITPHSTSLMHDNVLDQPVQEGWGNASSDTIGSSSDLMGSPKSANLISEEPTSELNVSFARETEFSYPLAESNDNKGYIAPPTVQSKKEILERIPSPIILSRTPFYHFDERLRKLYEESAGAKPTLTDTTNMENVTPKIEHEQKAEVHLYSSEPKTTILKSFNSTLDSSVTMPAEQEALIDKKAASDSQAPDTLVQEVEETIERTHAPKRIPSYTKSLDKLQKEALDDEEGRWIGNVPPKHMTTSELQPKLNEDFFIENKVSATTPDVMEVSVQEKMEPARFEESQESASETKPAFASLKQSTPLKEKSSSLRRSTLELYLETPYRREVSKSIDFNLSGYITSEVDKERCMEDSNPILSALKRSAAKTLNSKAVQEVSPTSTNEVTLDTPKPDVLASTMNSFPDNADKFKRMSQSVPAFLQDDTDGRETDSASESSFKIGRHRKSPSSLTNLSGSSGMASMSSVSGSVASMYSGDFGNVDVKGSIEFSVDYLEPVKEFLIYIYQCKELSVADVKKQRSDPYVKAYLLPEKLKMGKRKTAFKKKTLNPVYNEILRYKIPKEPLLKQTLNLSVWHHDVLGRNSFLGEVNVQLDTWDWNNSQRNWYPLEPRTPASGIGLENRGEIKLALKYIPVSPTVTGAKAGTTGEVHIWIKECLQLPMLRENKINSFVKCTILPDTSRKSRQKTRAVDKTPNPIFNHTMVYDGFKPDDLKEACVELTVWDHNRLSNHFIGGLRLGLGTGKSYGTAVDWMDSSHEETIMWERMGTSPNTWVEGLLPLRMFKMAKLAK